MIKFLPVALAAVLLAGCASLPTPKPEPIAAPVVYHKVVAKPVVKTAPAPVAVAPVEAQKQTFRQRWLSKFFQHRNTP
jgi:PBP1b-binding outer membrane lipoprotein LpoB